VISKPLSIVCPKEEGFFMSNETDQCFKLLNEEPCIWEEAYSKCHSQGLLMAQPSGYLAVKLRKDILMKYGDFSHTWIGAQGDGSSMNWIYGGGPISSSDPLWVSKLPSMWVSKSACLLLSAHGFWWEEYPD
ncbi:unnamed protein product, partial [Meganyctiphanes norvegica]